MKTKFEMVNPEIQANLNIHSADPNNSQPWQQANQPRLIHQYQSNLLLGPDGRPIQVPQTQHMEMQGNGAQKNLTPEQTQQLARQVLQQQRFLNPTGQARYTQAQNPALQMIDPNANANVTGAYQNTQQCWGSFSGCIASYFCCCCCTVPYGTVPQGYTGIIQRFGKFYKLVAPGTHYLNPELDQLVLVDKREQVLLLPKQIVQTKDNVTITIDAVVYYKVLDSYKSRFAVRDLLGALKELIETGLRNAIGRRTLQEVLQKREELSDAVMQQITEPAFNWGAAITRSLIQEIFFAKDQMANMSQGAVGKRIGEAFVIQSKADVEAARLMKEAAAILSTEAAMQIRYLESLESIARTANPKFIFFPADYNEIGANEATEDKDE
jgi:regulator of protease activity HflC (stomatin/prohibitin superfamily)